MKTEDRIRLFLKKFGFNPEPYHLCPKFDNGCAVNLCPLDPKIKLRTFSEFDQQKKCKMEKSIRKEIGTHFKLKNKGLTEREVAGQKRWDSMTPEQQQAKALNLKQTSLFYRLSQKGYKIIPKDKSSLPKALSNELESPSLSPENPGSMSNNEEGGKC